MPGNKKTEALMKTFTKETVAVIHTPMRGEKGGPRTVAMVEVDKTLTDRMKMEEAFKLTNNINDAWWNNEEVTPMFPGATCRSTSVGDMVLVGNKKYEFVGTEELVWKEV
jgi:hypothetical protein